MIIWLASYPKSGNTWLRALISSYYFSQKGFFDQNHLKFIDQFPSEKYFDLIKFQMQNQKEMFEMASKGDALSYYKKIGKMSGLNDDNDINVCMQTKEKFDHIINNGKRAQNAGVSGVPSFYINGRNYNSELDAISFVKLVEKMIERGLSDFTDLN